MSRRSNSHPSGARLERSRDHLDSVAQGTCTIPRTEAVPKPRRSTQPSDLSNQEVVLGMGVFLQYTVIGLTVGSFYALVALGYTIVYGIIRLINFAQGDLSMIGAFLGWTLLVGYGVQFLPLFPALVIAFVVPMLGTAVVNLAILEVAYKPLLNRSLLAILISALGMS